MAIRTFGLAAVSLAALAACSEPQGVGFSDVGSEAQTVTSAKFGQPAWPVSPSANATYGYLKKDVPQISAHSRNTNTHIQAEEAILVAKKKNRVSQPVRLNGQDLLFSVVWVNQRPFAVLRPKSGRLGMRVDGTSSLQSNALKLTGCPPVSGVYVTDTNRNKDGVTGMAVALGCITAEG